MPAVQTAGASDLVKTLLAETPIGMPEAARLFGTFKAGRPVHPSTVARWHLTGVRLSDGTRLRLEAIKIAGRLATSRAAIVRFLEAQQTAPPSNTPPRSPMATSRASEAADAELRRMGA